MRTLVTITAAILIFFSTGAQGITARSPNPEYRIRIASYKEIEKANAHVEKLKRSGEDASIEKALIKGKGTWYRVYAGKVKSRPEAERTARRLKEKGAITSFAVEESIPSRRPAEREPPLAKRRQPGTEAKKKAPENLPPKKGDMKETVSAEPARKEPVPAAAAAPVQATATAPAQSSEARQAPPPSPKSAVFDSAMAEFQAGRFREALAKFLETNREQLDSGTKEKVGRRIADCYFHLGARGDNRDLLNAVDSYKEVIQKYPNSGEENATAYYRLAKAYVQLKFYYEAKREFQNLYTHHHGSSYLPEAIFMIAEMASRTRNFSEAAARYKEYLQSYPQGEYSQRAYFGVGESYSQLQQNDLAETWYREALKKWSLEDVPKESILKLGYHYFRSRKYDDAAKTFFLFMNLYPDDEMTRDVLYSVARSLMEMDQPGIALKMFSLLIERYPQSREAQESAILMANIGVKKPGIKIPDIQGIQNYRNPLKVYNDMLAQSNAGDMTEGLLFQKGYALWKFGRYEESFDSFSLMLRLFPQGRYKEEGIRNIVQDINQLIGKYHNDGDDLAIARVYFKTPDNILTRDEDVKAVFRIGDSLRKIGLYFDSKRVLENLLKTAGAAADKNPILLAIADVENRRDRQDDAERILTEMEKNPRPDKRTQAGIRKLQGAIFFKKGQYGRAASSYAEAISSGEETQEAAALYRDYGNALKESNACEQAIASYQKAVAFYEKAQKEKKPPAEILADSYHGMGECYFRGGKYQEAAAMYKQSMNSAPENRANLWALYDMGRGYVSANKATLADKAFAELKSKGGEEFWPNIIDYYVREHAWSEKYAKYMR
jgi:TolA-binding protein